MAGGDTSAMNRALNALVSTLTPEQVQSFVQQMNAANTVAARSNPAATYPQQAELSEAFRNAHPASAFTAATSSNNQTSRSQPTRAKRTRENGKLRPLNSFIAFRSFYSAMFPDLSQKVKSGLLRLLWRSDPFKAKWAILAKAYSTVRDNHVGQVSLDTFLKLNGPFIGIVATGDYLRVMGLQLVEGADKQFTLIKETPGSELNQGDFTTNLSVDDVVDHCYKSGYVSRILPGNEASRQGAKVAMAVSAQSNQAHIEASSVGVPEQPSPSPSDISMETEIAGQDTVSVVGNPGHSYPVNFSHSAQQPPNVAIQHPATVANPGLSFQQGHASTAQSNGNGQHGHNQNNVINNHNGTGYTAADFETELRNAMRSYSYHRENFYGLFNPCIRDDPVVYNPYRGQSEFDPFDLNGQLGNI